MLGEKKSQGLLRLSLGHFCSVPQLSPKHPAGFSCRLINDHNLGTKRPAIDFCPGAFCTSPC